MFHLSVSTNTRLRSACIERTNVPTEVTHLNIQPMMEVTMGVSGRDLGHVADDVSRAIDAFGRPNGDDSWAPYDPSAAEGERRILPGSKIVISGEYEKMKDTFTELGGGLALERGSEANAPLARVILGGLLAGEPATLFILPMLYTLLVRDTPAGATHDVADPAGAGGGEPAHA